MSSTGLRPRHWRRAHCSSLIASSLFGEGAIMGTALVIGLVIAMCGGIAYVGDLLGRRMGKKRLSLFGLRPRHTAVIFTVITGVLIASVMLVVLMLASAGVRVAVTQGERLLNDNQ